VLLLLELLFIRERVLSCPSLSADDIDMFVDFIGPMHFSMRLDHNNNNNNNNNNDNKTLIGSYTFPVKRNLIFTAFFP